MLLHPQILSGQVRHALKWPKPVKAAFNLHFGWGPYLGVNGGHYKKCVCVQPHNRYGCVAGVVMIKMYNDTMTRPYDTWE